MRGTDAPTVAPAAARPATPPLTAGHVVFGSRHRTGRDLLVADLVGKQNARSLARASVVGDGPSAFRKFLNQRGKAASVVPGRGPVAWLRVLRHLRHAFHPTDAVRVLHAHGLRALLVVGALRLLNRGSWRAGAVYTNHGFVETAPLRRALLLIEPLLYRGIDRVVVCSPHQVARLARVTRRPVHLVDNAVAPVPPGVLSRSVARAWLGLGHDCLVIGVVGRLAPEKRHDVFMAAAARIARRYPDAILLVAGDGPRRHAVRRVARRHNLTDRVRFLGHVENVANVYAALDLLLHTSDTEAAPLAVMEAMAAGVPVVATAVGGVPALITDGVHGMLAPRRRPDLLGEAALRVLGDADLRQAIGGAARQRAAERFSLVRMCDDLDAVYAAAVAGDT